MVVEGGAGEAWAVAFHPDGKHFFNGTSNGIRRWQVTDGQELGKQTEMTVYAISVSKDQKWIVCGTRDGATVWDAEFSEKVAEVESGEWVFSVDVAPDCTKFATGTRAGHVTIWSITTREKLLGPLEHGDNVFGVRFSPDGERLAAAYYIYSDSTIRIFDAHNGDHLISIENRPGIPVNSFLPIAWSAHGQQLFVVSKDYKFKSFDSSTGSPRGEWKIHEKSDSDDPMSIALSANGKFIASSAGRFISFWDTSTYTQLGIVEETQKIQSIALSPNGCRLAAGYTHSESSTIWNLRGILPDSYLPDNVSIPFLKSIMTLIHECTRVNILFQTVSAGSSCVQNGAIDVYALDQLAEESNPPGRENSSQQEDDALPEVRISIGPSRRHRANDGNRQSCNQVVHQHRYSTTMR